MNIRPLAALALSVIATSALPVQAAERKCGAGSCSKKTATAPAAGQQVAEAAPHGKDAGCSKKEVARDAACSKKDAAKDASCSKKDGGKDASCSKKDGSKAAAGHDAGAKQ